MTEAWRLLGLGMRAGKLVVGTSGVRAALKRSELALVIVASDRSMRTEEKVVRLADARGIPTLAGPDANDLGRSVGRESIQVVGVRDAQLAAGIQKKAVAERA